MQARKAKTTARYQALEKLDMASSDDRSFWIKYPGDTFEALPDCLTKYLVMKKMISTTILPARKREQEAQGGGDELKRQWSDKELATRDWEIRIQPLQTLTWRYVDGQGRYDGAGRMDARSASWLRADIAKAAIKAGVAVLCPFPDSGDRSKVQPGAMVALGEFKRKNFDLVEVGVEPGRVLA